MAKKDIHPKIYHNVEVTCICGEKTILASSTIPGPIKVESCKACHPAYNQDKKIEIAAKWRRQKYLEKLEKMQKIQGSSK